MTKRIAIIGAAVLVSVLMLVSAYCQDDMTVVANDGFINPQRPEALFVHEDHNAAAEVDDCSVCHHVYEDGVKLEGESSEDMRCADCHGLERDGDTPSLMQAFHLNCKGCHEERKAGPIMCGECHVRNGAS